MLMDRASVYKLWFRLPRLHFVRNHVSVAILLLLTWRAARSSVPDSVKSCKIISGGRFSTRGWQPRAYQKNESAIAAPFNPRLASQASAGTLVVGNARQFSCYIEGHSVKGFE